MNTGLPSRRRGYIAASAPTVAQRARTLTRYTAYVAAPTAAALVVVLGAAAAADVDSRDLLRDPATVAGEAFHLGVLSNIGIIGWSATVAVLVLALAAHLVGRGADDRGLARLAGWGLGITAVLLVDDLLLLHEEVLPETGIDGRVVPAGQAALLAVALGRCWPVLRTRRGAELLALALAGFAASVLVDLGPFGAGWAPVFEDVAKLLAIEAWLAFWSLVALDLAAPARGFHHVDLRSSSVGDTRTKQPERVP